MITKFQGLVYAACRKIPIRSDGTVGGFARGTRKKIILLKKEGIKIISGRIKV